MQTATASGYLFSTNTAKQPNDGQEKILQIIYESKTIDNNISC